MGCAQLPDRSGLGARLSSDRCLHLSLLSSNRERGALSWLMLSPSVWRLWDGTDRLEYLEERSLWAEIWVEVTTVDDARRALERDWITGVVLVGAEAAGECGRLGSFLWVQRYLNLLDDQQQVRGGIKPFWIRGGASPAAAAAALSLGACGVITDEHWALCIEASPPQALQQELETLQGTHSSTLSCSIAVGSLSRHVHHDRPAPQQLIRALCRPGSLGWHVSRGTHDQQADLLWGTRPDRDLIPVSAMIEHHISWGRGARLSSALDLFLERVSTYLETSQEGSIISENNAWAQAHQTRFPIAQGPMTRVSDVAPFALAVAEAGALPFVALSLMTPEQARMLLTRVQERLGPHAWGIGILGFTPPQLREAHLELIREFKPRAALIAGGRPSQVRSLEAMGIPTYLHVPSPKLLKLFLKEGARRFVFEGSECGGHIGPRTSWSLWSEQVEVLEEFSAPEELSLLFAGGIHDARSAQAVSVFAGPLSARGARVGALMGTAYLFTREAVETGAILPSFQEVALSCNETTTLHTAPGHATRCAVTPFVDSFNHERARLHHEGVESRQMWTHLEHLNVGRLRVASKGLTRVGDTLQTVDAETRRVQGMYMLGEVAALRTSVTTMEELHLDLTTPYRRPQALDDLSSQPRGEPESQPAHPDSSSDQEKSSTSSLPSNDPELRSPKSSASIAIIGISCLFADAQDHEDFWVNILDGIDSITEVPDQRWSKEIYYDPNAPAGQKSASKWGGFIDPIPFDPMRYGIPPKTMAAVEPVQLLALEVAARALEDAGYIALPIKPSSSKSSETESGVTQLRSFDRAHTSVIFGAEAGNDLANAYGLRNGLPQWVGPLDEALDDHLPTLTEDSFAGVLANVISGRVANRLDLGGSNYTVDAACASALTALDVGIKELLIGDSDLVLCGGADLHNSINDYLMFSSVHALSPEGRCKTFDQSADGITLGEGVAVLVLKRLDNALKDGDRVYAVIEGVGASSDGKHLGLTAPRKDGQLSALKRAYSRAQVSPKKVGLIEAHGTGTVVGDRTELQAITELYLQAGATPRSCALGSVKSQIGHTKCAAGLAGLIKVALSIYHATLTPTLHIETPNQAYEPEVSPFAFYKAPTPWLDRERWGAVSAFGFGGTNFHAVLRSAPLPLSNQGVSRFKWPVEPLCLYGEDLQSAQALAQRYSEGLKRRRGHSAPSSHALREWATSLLHEGRTGGAQGAQAQRTLQAICLVNGWVDAEEKLDQFAQTGEADHVKSNDLSDIYGPVGSSSPSSDQVAFVFSGQGAQRVGMLRELFTIFAEARAHLREGEPWARLIFPPPPIDLQEKRAQQERLTDTRNAQPALGICDLALYDVLQSVGVEAKHYAGHSYGELVALSAAGAISTAALPQLSALRGESILNAAQGGDAGKMAAIKGSAQAVAEALKDAPGVEGVVLANLNAPAQTVISGPSASITQAIKTLKAHRLRGREIPVACAFHSPVIATGGVAFTRALDHVARAPLDGAVTVWSNQHAAPYPTGRSSVDELPQRLGEHIANPVRFTEQIEAMYSAGVRVFVEVGPGRIQSGLISQILRGRPHSVVPCAPVDGTLSELLSALSALSMLGVRVDWSALFASRMLTPQTLETLSAAQSSRLLWWVDGQRAWADRGPQPKHAMKVPERPLGYGTLTRPSEKVSVSSSTPHVPSASIPSPDTPHDLTPFLEGIMPTDFQPALPPPPSEEALNRPQSTSQVEIYRAATAYFMSMKTLAEAQHQVMIALLAQQSADTSRDAQAPPLPSPDAPTTLGAQAWWQTPAPSPFHHDDQSAERPKERRAVSSAPAPLSISSQLTESTDDVESSPSVNPRPPTISNTLPVITSLSLEAIEALFLELVSERTGYPTDLLGLDLDLEADLSIDSIKRIEILGALGERLGLDETNEEERDDVIEELAIMKSLREMITWLSAYLKRASTPTHEPIVEKISIQPEDMRPKSKGERAPRSVRSWRLAPLSSIESVSDPQSTLVMIDLPSKASQLKQCCDERFSSELIHVSLTLDRDTFPLADIATSYPSETLEALSPVESLFLCLQSLWVRCEALRSISVFSPHPKTPLEALWWGGLSGLLKSAGRERYHIKMRLIQSKNPLQLEIQTHERLTLKMVGDEPESLDVDRVPSIEVVRYDDADTRWSEVYLNSDEREDHDSSTLTQESQRDLVEQGGFQERLKRGVLLVTGGARGITASCLRVLSPCPQLICLIGRSAHPDFDETPELTEWFLEIRRYREDLPLTDGTSPEDERALKHEIVRRYPNYKLSEVSPLARRVIAQYEIRAQREALTRRGIESIYLSVDLCDHDRLIERLDLQLTKSGFTRADIHAVIHGAGVIDDQRLEKKALDRFRRVIQVKTQGALNLLKITPNHTRWIFFSSISSALGNIGQTDYSAANSALDSLAERLNVSAQLPQCRARSIQWGPWRGAGMVRPALLRHYERAQMRLLSLEEGTEALQEEWVSLMVDSDAQTGRDTVLLRAWPFK